MAEKIESSSEFIEELASDEILPCKDCTCKGLDIEGEYFCVDCRIFLCKQCMNGHRQRDRGSHIVIDVESGCAYLGDYSRREFKGIWLPNDSESITSAVGDSYDLGDLENARGKRSKQDSNHKNSNDSSSTDKFISPKHEEFCPRDFLTGKEASDRETGSLKILHLFSRMGKKKKKTNGGQKPSAKEAFYVNVDVPRLDIGFKKRDGIRNFNFITDATIPMKENSYVSSVAMLTEDTLVIVDNGNYCIIVVQISQGMVRIKTNIEFKDKPFGVDRICNNEFVLTFPEKNAVRFINIEGDDFHVGQTQDEHSAGFGICMLNKNMLIAYPASRLIRILSKGGGVIRTIKPDSINLSFKHGHVAVFDGNIYILDWLQKRVCKCHLLRDEFQTRLTTNDVYCPDGNPADFTVSSAGDLYVALPRPNRITRICGSTMKLDCMYDSSNGVHTVECLSSYQGVLAALEYKPLRAEIEIRMFEI